MLIPKWSSICFQDQSLLRCTKFRGNPMAFNFVWTKYCSHAPTFLGIWQIPIIWIIWLWVTSDNLKMTSTFVGTCHGPLPSSFVEIWQTLENSAIMQIRPQFDLRWLRNDLHSSQDEMRSTSTKFRWNPASFEILHKLCKLGGILTSDDSEMTSTLLGTKCSPHPPSFVEIQQTLKYCINYAN